MSHDIVFSPADIATLGQEYLSFRREHKEASVAFPIPKMSNRVYPMFPGEMMSIIARPGHAKTGVMMYWARSRANWLRENGYKNRVVVYATWEQSVEELHSFYIASQKKISVTNMARGVLSEQDWNQAITASSERISEPLWFIGHSVMRRTGRAQINTDVLGDALDKIQNFGDGFEIDMLMVDYLQRIPPKIATESPVIAYSRTLDDIKNLALGFGVPAIVGVQASRDVEDKKTNKLPIPEIHHGQWTSNVEQSSDRVLSLVRPRRYCKDGEMFGSVKVIGHSQLLISVLKQKLGEANFQEWVKFNPIYNKLDDNELVNPVPDGG